MPEFKYKDDLKSEICNTYFNRQLHFRIKYSRGFLKFHLWQFFLICLSETTSPEILPQVIKNYIISGDKLDRYDISCPC